MDSAGSQQLPRSNSSNNEHSINSNTRQYSEVTQTTAHKQTSSSSTMDSNLFPSREQAILMNVQENLKLVDYVTCIGKIIGPKEILFASRISNSRICMFLSGKKHVDYIIQYHNKINIDGIDINIRRLITPAKRIIISNVCPSIPHKVLERVIYDMGFKGVSPMSFLRAGLQSNEYTHVLSFRKHIYVQPDDTISLPSSTVIKHGETNYRIFFGFDELTCFTCKQPGHVANNCPNVSQEPHIIGAGEYSTTDIPLNSNDNQPELPLESNQQTENKTKEPTSLLDETLIDLSTSPVNESNKRHAISPVSSITETPSHASTSENLAIHDKIINILSTSPPKSSSQKKPPKMLRRSDSCESITPISDLISPVKEHVEADDSNFPLSYNQLVDFFENVHGNPDPLSLSKRYTKDTSALIDMLNNLKPLFTHRSIKNRTTRLIKKLRSQLSQEELHTTEPEPEDDEM